MEFGDRLSKARTDKGLTQVGLAEKMRVHRFTISKWEMGATRPQKPTDFDDLAFHLNVRVEWLRDGTGEQGPYAAPLGDRQRRADIGRRLPPRQEAEAGAPEVDWVLVASIVRALEGGEPRLSPDALGRALALTYSLVSRGREVLDDRLVREIRAAVRG